MTILWCKKIIVKKWCCVISRDFYRNRKYLFYFPSEVFLIKKHWIIYSQSYKISLRTRSEYTAEKKFGPRKGEPEPKLELVKDSKITKKIQFFAKAKNIFQFNLGLIRHLLELTYTAFSKVIKKNKYFVDFIISPSIRRKSKENLRSFF